eukprot:gene3168-1475_t
MFLTLWLLYTFPGLNLEFGNVMCPRSSVGKEIRAFSVTDKNGQFVVQLNSGELFAGMIGVGKLTKISSIDPACSLLYDSIGQLIILRSEEYKNNVSSFIYPLHAEIDSAVDMGACELVSFSTDIVGGWYQIDVGEHINIKAELISESSNTSIMIAFPPHSNLKASVEETADSIGKYFKKTRTIDVFVAENSSTIQSAKLKPFVTTENYLDSPAYCTVVLNRNQLDLETYLSQQDSIFRRANEEVVVRELTGRSDFYFALDPNAIVNGHLNYSFIFEGDGEYIFIVSLDSKVSFCHLSAYLIVTRELMPEAQNSLAVTISVCLGISFSIIYLAVSFLRYRHNTILEHIKEAEIVKRKQELRYLSNLYDLKGSEGSGVSSRRKSSVLKEAELGVKSAKFWVKSSYFFKPETTEEILKEAQEKSKGSPNIERLKQCLPLTISASWKLGNIVNGIPIWENHVFSSEADNGVIAAQAVINAPAESVIKEMVKPRMLQMLHPWVSDTSLAPGTPQKQLEQSEVLSDCLSVFCNVPSIKKIVNIYVKWKNCCLMKRRWKYGKDNVSWLVMNPEYKVYQHLFGHWQCCLATDIPTGKDTMCLLSIFTAPTTDDETRLAVLGAAMASQVVNMREHMDSLYLKKIVRKDSTVIQRKSSIEQRAKSPTAEKKLDNKEALQSRTVPKNFAGVEGIGYVEAPAEIKDITEHPQPAPAIKIESQEAALRDAKLSKYKDTLDTAFELLVDVYNANETTPGWTYLGNRNGIEVYRLQGDASCPSDCFKGTAEVNVPLTYALQYVTEINFKKEWDDVFNEGKVIEDIDEVTKVTYMEYKPVWPTTARDFCSITATRHLKGDIYGVAVKATTHPSCPPVKGKQRGEIITGGFVVEGTSIDPPQCKVTYVTRADLKGKIPASMVNKVNEKQPMYTAIIRDKIEERFMYQDPPHEGDTKIIAARQYPSILEASTKVEGSVENQINSATSTLAISNKNGSDDGNQDDSNAATATNFRELSKDEIESFIPDTDVKWDAISETSVTSLDQMEEMSKKSDSDSKEAVDELEDKTEPQSSQRLEHLRDRLGNLDFKVLGNQTAAKLLEEVLLAAKVDSTSQPADGYTEDIWT